MYLEGVLLGYAKLNKHQAQTDLKTDDGLELERIYVKEQFQGKGYGRLMLEEIKTIALQDNKAFI